MGGRDNEEMRGEWENEERKGEEEGQNDKDGDSADACDSQHAHCLCSPTVMTSVMRIFSINLCKLTALVMMEGQRLPTSLPLARIILQHIATEDGNNKPHENKKIRVT